MKRTSNLLLIVVLLGTVAWSAAVPDWSAGSAHDIKAIGAYLMADDVSAEGLAALDTALPGQAVACTAGVAGPYGCDDVDLLGLVPLAGLGGALGNDSWGWTSADGQEIAIMGTGRNTAFVDVTDPTSPTVIAQLPNAGGDRDEPDGALWRDVKVNNDHAYIVSERGGGLQIVDLNALVELPADPTRIIAADATWTGGTGAFALDGFHNLVINEETDTAFLVGVDSFNGRGMFIVDIADPLAPAFSGRFDHGLTVHDAQCTIYRGPDTDYNGSYAHGDADGDPSNGTQAELCFTFDEDEINIVDVTDNAQPTIINTLDYVNRNGAGTVGTDNGVTGFYAHQGWLSRNHDFLIWGDELDELNTRVGALTGGTTTYWVELADLDAKDADGSFNGADVTAYAHDTLATDHNLYVVDDLIFQANYTAGLRVLRYTEDGLRNGELEEVGYFDVDPGVDAPGFSGAWNVYPFFDSGTIVVSTLDEGLFVLDFTGDDG